jgi:hypothetical protein
MGISPAWEGSSSIFNQSIRFPEKEAIALNFCLYEPPLGAAL